MSMIDRRSRTADPRRTRAQVIGAGIATVALLWALLLRDDPTLTAAQAAAGWLMVAGLVVYLAMVWRRRA
jgi:hypothetical protein